MSAIDPVHIKPQSAFRQILKDDVRYSSGNTESVGDNVNGWYDRLMTQSGIQSSPALWLVLCLIVGIGLGGLAFVLSEQLLLTGIMFAVGLFLPLLLAMILRTRRQNQIMEQLPAMADELARSARSGRSLESSLRVVAADTPSPLGDEMRTVVRRTEMGIDPGTAVSDLPERTGVNALTMFTSAVKVHQDTGGDLMGVLERMATSIRDRLHFTKRLKAATIASRLGAIMMLIIPPCILAFYTFRDSNFLTQLLDSPLGRICLFLGIGLQIVGAIAVYLILRRSARF